MKLHELLDTLSLTAEVRKSIEAEVDAIKARAVAEVSAQLKSMEAEIVPLRESAAKVKKQERSSALEKLLPENVKGEFKQDILALAGITDNDTDEVVKGKIAETLKARPFYQTEADPNPAIIKSKDKGGEAETKLPDEMLGKLID